MGSPNTTRRMLWPPKLSKSLFFLAALTAICYTSTSFAEEVNDSPSNSFLDSAKQVAEGSEVKTPEPQADAPDVPRHPETAAKDKTHSSKVPVRTSDSQRSLLLALENFANGSAEKKSKDGGADGKEIYTKLVSTAAVGLGLFFWLQSRVKSSTFGSVLRKLLTLVIILLVAVGALSTLNGSSFRLRGDPTTGQKGLLDIFSSSQAQQYHRIDQYNEKFDGDRDVQMVNDYYTVSTDFYEYGWSDSFHFAHTLQNETFQDSLVRQEERIAIELGLKKGMRVLDLGSGVGGPARNIAKFSQAEVVGITINEYQVERSRQLTAQAGLTDLVSFVQGDYTDMHAIPDASFDHAYAIEATCHAPRLVDVYREAYRVLKPGGYLGSYEWLTTPTYDRSDPAQRKAVHDIEYGVGLPPLRNFSDVVAVAKEVGFEMIRDFDLRSLEDKEHVKTKPWYYRMDMNYLSYYATHITCYITETLGLAPKGTVATHAMLMHGLDGLVGCGKLGCFTPMHWVLMRKPL